MPAGIGLMMQLLLFLLLAAIAWVNLPLSASAATAGLRPHRAVYRMVLATADRSSDVVSANGIMIYRFSRTCDGWTVENQTFLRMFYDDDSVSDTLWSYASWEGRDGHHFRFHARFDQDGKTIEKLEGDAELKGNGRGGHARFREPEERRIPLPAGTVFPTAHLREMLAAGGGGKHALNRTVFDGASVDSPYVVNALFGPLAARRAEASAAAFKLPVVPAWWTQMAFFPLADRSGEPEFEVGAEYRADGIADAIVQHFDDFSLDVRLREIELLASPDC